MTVTAASTGNKALDNLASGYKEKTTEEKDPLGRDAFLTMLVAQLKNQDPLNPMEGTDFTAQLAQFSSLEQQFNMNDSLEAIVSALEGKTQQNLLDYIGKEVRGNSNTISVSNGTATTGYYTIDETADVAIAIYDKNGNLVKNIYAGQQDAGTHAISWDGTDLEGRTATTGSYTFEILALNVNGGYVEAKTTVEGKVTGVTYEKEIPYLQIGEHLLDPATVTSVVLASEEKEDVESL